MTWDMIWGHETVIASLQRAVTRGRLAQVVLLSGPPAIGKSLLATCLAQMLLQTDAARLHLHPDMQWVEPKGATSTIPVETIREMLRRLHHTPIQAQRQVTVILMIEHLNAEAANTLLKTLEEPPARAQIILTTDDVGQCLPTIVSRCRVMRLSPWSRDALAARLVREHGADQPTARHIASQAEGRVGKALALLHDKKRPTVRDVFAALAQEQRWTAAQRERLFVLLEQYVWWCRDQVCRQAGCDELVTMADAATTTPQLSLTESADLLAEGMHALEALQQRVNPKLILWTLQQRWHARVPTYA